MMKLPSSPDELQQFFSKHHIALMASSPPGQSIQKYFFYAQQVHTVINKIDILMNVHKIIISYKSKVTIQNQE